MPGVELDSQTTSFSENTSSITQVVSPFALAGELEEPSIVVVGDLTGAAFTSPASRTIGLFATSGTPAAVAPDDFSLATSIVIPAENYTSPVSFGLISGTRSDGGTFPGAAPLSIVNDNIVEMGEKLSVELVSIPSPLGGPNATDVDGDLTARDTTIHTIIDNDTVVTVSVGANALEDTGTLTYTFTRTNTLGGALSVDYTVGGTAMASDHNAASGSIVFGATDLTVDLVVTPMVDAIVEFDETVLVTVVDGTDYTAGSPDAATGTILDDDLATVGISSAAVSRLEDSGTTVGYTVSTAALLQRPVTVTIASTNVTATAGLDYTAINTDVYIRCRPDSR